MSDELEKKEPGLEERFAKIDAILDAMEDENVTLDRSFALYKEGLEQIKAAGQSLDTIEKAMLVLNAGRQTLKHGSHRFCHRKRGFSRPCSMPWNTVFLQAESVCGRC